MHGPELAGWLLVALCAGTGGYCLWRVRGRSPWWRQIAAAEGVMGLGMAAMALPADLSPAFAVFFATLAVWGGVLFRTGVPHGAHHALEAAAMVYMALAMATAPGSHATHSPGGMPWLTGPLLAYFAGHVLRTGRALVPAGPDSPHSGRESTGSPPAVSGCGTRPPEMAAACRLTLSVGMVAMLLTL